MASIRIQDPVNKYSLWLFHIPEHFIITLVGSAEKPQKEAQTELYLILNYPRF